MSGEYTGRPSRSEAVREAKERQIDIQRAAEPSEKKCGCGIPESKCAPENCTHQFAYAALWGD